MWYDIKKNPEKRSFFQQDMGISPPLPLLLYVYVRLVTPPLTALPAAGYRLRKGSDRDLPGDRQQEGRVEDPEKAFPP